jgi:magnesium transporter
MNGHLVTIDGSYEDATPSNLKRLLDSSTRFWLDIAGPDEEQIEILLRDTFGFHPLAVEDSRSFGQRPKLDTFDDFALVVAYGATVHGGLVEVHCFFTEQYLVTVHRDPCPDLAELAERWHQRPTGHPDHVMLLYRVLDCLVDGYFPVLAQLDDEIDELEDDILRRPTDEQLGRLFDMKRSLIAMRKIVTPQRDMVASLLTSPEQLPGMNNEAERYFRDLYDHLIRISDLVDSYRDLMSGALDTHLSTVSNRLNVVMKQLTIIATIFLPITFLTGFFGQNFAWMVVRITSLPVFLLLGIGLQVLTVIALIVFFRRRGWLSSAGTVPPATAARRPSVPRARRWHVLHPEHAPAPQPAEPAGSAGPTGPAVPASSGT